MQFTAADDTGTVGLLTRTGKASADGNSLTVVVPEEARTGPVRIVGSSASFPLQIVPTLRSVGGTLAAGNTILLEGTGLAAGDLKVSIDGVTATAPAVHTTFDSGLAQQVVDLTAPAGVSAGVITVTTSGGNFTLRPSATALTAIVAPALSGTPALAGVGAANVGQTITLQGTGPRTTDQCRFPDLTRLLQACSARRRSRPRAARRTAPA